MTTSTLTLAPEVSTSGAGAYAESRSFTHFDPTSATDHALARAAYGCLSCEGRGWFPRLVTDPSGEQSTVRDTCRHCGGRGSRGGYEQWMQHVWSAAGCAHPIQLTGEITTVDTETGRLLSTVDTTDLPDGRIYKACGNRRATVCPSCAETYRRDAYEVIRTGLVGGKGVTSEVATHPALFVTLTAPGFGTVHTRRTSRTGQAIACRPRRHPQLCPHGVDLRCSRIHGVDEHTLGIPLCLDCYDYPGQIAWNYQAGELWRRTRIAMDRGIRRLARAAGVPGSCVRLRYAKVAEMQRRGVVHFHIVIRLDGAHPDLPGLILPPPDQLGVEHVDQAVRDAVAATRFTTEAHPVNADGWVIGWGGQLDTRPIRLTGDGQMTDEMAAGYLAKYATKSTETTGHVSRRLDDETIDLYANPAGSHAERLVAACWDLGKPAAWRGLRRWAHMLGFGGHFLTKAHAYSVTFAYLRHRRVVWRRTESVDIAREHTDETTVVINWLAYTGAGWRTTGDALLANTAAARAREHARAARDELTSQL